MADCRFISRFNLGADDKALRIQHTIDGSLELIFSEEDYFWSLDDDTTSGQLDFAKALKDKLDAASSETWTVQIVGVNYTDASEAQGAVRLSVSSGLFQIKWSDAGDSTLDPRIMGEAAGNTTDKPAVSASSYISPFVVRYSWVPRAAVYDASPMTTNLIMSQSTTSGGFVDTVHFASIEQSVWELQYINSALVSIACAEESSRSSAAGLTVDDPNAPFEAWYIDVVTGQLDVRVYTDLEEITTDDFDGPYTVLLASGTQHDSLAAATRPMPSAADVFNVRLQTLESM